MAIKIMGLLRRKVVDGDVTGSDIAKAIPSGNENASENGRHPCRKVMSRREGDAIKERKRSILIVATNTGIAERMERKMVMDLTRILREDEKSTEDELCHQLTVVARGKDNIWRGKEEIGKHELSFFHF